MEKLEMVAPREGYFLFFVFKKHYKKRIFLIIFLLNFVIIC